MLVVIYPKLHPPSKIGFIHPNPPSLQPRRGGVHVSLEGGLFPRKRKNGMHLETTNSMGFQPLVFGGVVRSLLMVSRFVFCWILLVKTNISMRKWDSKSVVVSLKKRIVQMLADCFGRFDLWICLETSNVCKTEKYAEREWCVFYWS